LGLCFGLSACWDVVEGDVSIGVFSMFLLSSLSPVEKKMLKWHCH
jgi:hypothetical protein